jgi:hypothetical protein
MEAKYYDYLLELSLGGQKLVHRGNEFGVVFHEALPLYFEGQLDLVKTLIHQLNFKEAMIIATLRLKRPMSWSTLNNFGYSLPPLLEAKFSLCVALTLIALNKCGGGDDWLHTRYIAPTSWPPSFKGGRVSSL